MDETESDQEGDAQTEGEDQFDEDDDDDVELIDTVAEGLNESTFGDEDEDVLEKALDSGNLDQGNVEELKELKSSTPAEEVVVDKEKLDKVVNIISMDVLLEGTAPSQLNDSSRSQGKNVVHEVSAHASVDDDEEAESDDD